MVLIIDPYANRHLSRSDIRLVNQVAGVLMDDHDDLDPHDVAGAITHTYRTGMRADALRQHVERHLRLRRS